MTDPTRHVTSTPAEDPRAPITGHPEPAPDPLALEVDAAGWLVGDRVVRIPSVRSSRLTTPASEPLGVMLHYTATDHGTAASLAKRIRTYDPKKDRAASWHVIVAHDGTLYQSIPFERGAWHCAKGRLYAADGEHTINRSTIGVELEGHGADKHPPPIEQVIALERLYSAILGAYDMPPDWLALEHRKYDPSRRADPGDGWARIAANILARLDAAAVG